MTSRPRSHPAPSATTRLNRRTGRRVEMAVTPPDRWTSAPAAFDPIIVFAAMTLAWVRSASTCRIPSADGSTGRSSSGETRIKNGRKRRSRRWCFSQVGPLFVQFGFCQTTKFSNYVFVPIPYRVSPERRKACATVRPWRSTDPHKPLATPTSSQRTRLDRTGTPPARTHRSRGGVTAVLNLPPGPSCSTWSSPKIRTRPTTGYHGRSSFMRRSRNPVSGEPASPPQRRFRRGHEGARSFPDCPTSQWLQGVALSPNSDRTSRAAIRAWRLSSRSLNSPGWPEPRSDRRRRYGTSYEACSVRWR